MKQSTVIGVLALACVGFSGASSAQAACVTETYFAGLEGQPDTMQVDFARCFPQMSYYVVTYLPDNVSYSLEAYQRGDEILSVELTEEPSGKLYLDVYTTSPVPGSDDDYHFIYSPAFQEWENES